MLEQLKALLVTMNLEEVVQFILQLEQMRDMESIELDVYAEIKTLALQKQNDLSQI